MPAIPPIVTTDWLADHLGDPTLRLVDVTTYLRQTGATSGAYRTAPFTGTAEPASGAVQSDLFKEFGANGAAFTIDGTTMRLTIHPDGSAGGHYRFWSGREVYEESHIPGAVHADILSFCDPDSPIPYTALSHEAFAARMGALGLGEPGTRIVFYDQGIGISFWASRLWWQIRMEGFDDVAVLEGGFRKWTREGRRIATGPETLPPIAFSGTRRPELLATVEEVSAAIGDPSKLIVDSLSPADYRGETASYGGRGHIPSSINVYCGDHTEAETTALLDDGRLRERLAATGTLDPDRKVIAYCGGGFGATWNALVFHHLGKRDVAVFDGSMFEWSSDPSRPLETGPEG